MVVRRPPVRPLTPAEAGFVDSSAGLKSPCSPAEGSHVLRHFKMMMGESLTALLDDSLHPDFHATEESFQRLLLASTKIMNLFQGSRTMSIDTICERLAQQSVLSESLDVLRARKLTFALIGCFTLLYKPKWQPSDLESLDVDTQGSGFPQRTSAPTSKADRPIDELIRSLGETLPRNKSSVSTLNARFQVSTLNASTLHQLGRIDIVWVDTISSHLYFDDVDGKLFVFRSPSSSKLWDSDQSLFAS